MTDTGWDEGLPSGWGSTLWTREWKNAEGEVVRRAVVEARDDMAGWFFATDFHTAQTSLAAAKRVATTHPYYPEVAL
jgi:hypothetical protein